MANTLLDRVTEKVTEKLTGTTANPEEMVSRAEEIILEATYRKVINERGFWLWVDIALAVYAAESAGNTETSGPVSSIKRGDTTISYAENASATENLPPTLQSRLNTYKAVKAR